MVADPTDGGRRAFLGRVWLAGSSTPGAALLFTLITVVWTWPVSAAPGRVIPEDLGDPLLNCWILGWGADHLLRVLGGDLSAVTTWFHANIFHPEPLALAYSEHLTAQAIQILPVFAATRNLVLCYNLLFLSSFVLSALGAYLLVRELTGSRAAALVGGLVYGFVPYRASQAGHLQVLSSQWMPFALYFLRRYFDCHERRWAFLAAAALVLQNLSCGYFLIYFAPFAVSYALYEVWSRALARDGRTWRHLALAGVAVAGLTLPFLWPYVQVRQLGLVARPPSEVDHYSADVFSYFTADPDLHLWGPRLQTFAKPEGALFLGFAPLLLASIGLLAHGRLVWGRAQAVSDSSPRWLRHLVIGVLLALMSLSIAIVFAGGSIRLLRRVSPYVANVSYVVPAAAVCGGLLLVVSRRARAVVRGVPRSAVSFYLWAALAAAWLSCGRIIESMGWRISHETLYDWLYRHVPGFDGLRVPSRFAMLVALFLAVLAGYGAAALASGGRRARILLVAASLFFLAESASAPLDVHALAWAHASGRPSGITTADDAARIYRAVATLPSGAVLTEFPFGDLQHEVRYLFFSTRHWRRLTNGYSGAFPASYVRRRQLFERPWVDPDAAWQELAASGSTHVILHEWAFGRDQGAEINRWLRQHGARPLAVYRTDTLFVLP